MFNYTNCAKLYKWQVSVTTEKKYTALGDPKEMTLNESVMPKLLEWYVFCHVKI